MKRFIIGIIGGLFITPQQLNAGIAIQFDYSSDGSFFSDSTRKTVLEAAASSLSTYINDSLSAISPSGGNSWTIKYTNPATGVDAELTNPTINANTLTVYVGGRSMSGGILGEGGPGGYSSSGSSGWLSTVSTRGQTGAPGNDFGPWGGSITFNSSATWYYDTDLSTSADIPSGSVDFYSVAVHELAHVLGIGIADSWTSRVTSGKFSGTASMTLYGSAVPLNDTTDHWNNGIISTLPGTSTTQEAAMDPDIATGTRKYFTSLDYAGLKDIGWDVTAVPELEQTMGLASMALMGFALWRRRKTI